MVPVTLNKHVAGCWCVPGSMKSCWILMPLDLEGAVWDGMVTPPEFRRRVLDSVAAARRVVDVARDPGISEQSIYPFCLSWCKR